MISLTMNQYRGILLDVDGVIVKDREPIPGAVDAVHQLMQQFKVLFLSNNSLYSRVSYAKKLNAVGIDASEDHILHSGLLVARYLSQHQASARVFLIGHQGLRDEITEAGHTITEDAPDWLVTGNDEHINYEKLTKGLRILVGGGRWVASNGDATFPGPEGLRPGAGSIIGAFRGMGFEPEAIVGKPSLFCMHQALEVLDVDDPKRVLMIGDRLDSDIKGANNAGLDSLLVFSGVTSVTEYESSPIRATYTLSDLSKVFD